MQQNVEKSASFADEEHLVATISGPALSMLLYENCRTLEQFGFLLGETATHVTRKMTDTEGENIENVKEYINIKSIVAYPSRIKPFFENHGALKENKLMHFLDTQKDRVIGWYHYREDHNYMASSLRDRHLHKNLSSFFSKNNESLSKENFIFMLLSCSKSESGGTHKCKHLILRKHSNVFQRVSLRINNLGADCTKPDGSDYKPVPKFTLRKFDAFDNVYKKIRNELDQKHGVEAVTMIQNAADALLNQCIPVVNESDKKVHELEIEAKALETEIFKLNFFKLQRNFEMARRNLNNSNQPSKNFENLSDSNTLRRFSSSEFKTTVIPRGDELSHIISETPESPDQEHTEETEEISKISKRYSRNIESKSKNRETSPKSPPPCITIPDDKEAGDGDAYHNSRRSSSSPIYPSSSYLKR
ncbi:hypothetical protein TKK_0014118 [Trichogramma kaykai]|uniref:BRISC complex subunit FAM175B helical domain-containing protein n=1 Tax=Trichogramma kaykai TaxID=54128 RepID=A0ABD2WEA6_9HYME